MYFFQTASKINFEDAFRYEELENRDNPFEGIVGVAILPLNDLIAAVSCSHLYLWNKKEGLLGVSKRSRSSLEVLGINKDVSWSPNGKKLCVITRRGNVIIYAVIWRQGGYKQFTPIFGQGVHTLRRNVICHLELKSVNHMKSKMPKHVVLTDYVLVFLHEESKFAVIDWEGEDDNTDIRYYSDLPFCQCNEEISYVTAPFGSDIFGLVVTSGFAYIYRLNKKSTAIEGACIHTPSLVQNLKAIFISINMEKNLFAVSTKAGSIIIYELLEFKMSLSSTIKHIVKLETQEEITYMNWSNSGLTLGVCLLNNNIYFVSYRGCVMSVLELNNEDRSIDNKFLSGIHWGKNDFTMIYTIYKDEVHIYLANVSKYFLYLDNQRINELQPCIVSANNVCLTKTSISLLNFLDQESLKWETLALPNTCGSIKAVSRSPDTRYLLICKNTGFICYSGPNESWKYFKRKEEEGIFSYRNGISWYGNYAIIGCWSNIDHTYCVICFDCSKEFLIDEMNIRYLNTPVCCLFVIRDILYIYSQNNLLAEYYISIDENSMINLEVKCCVELVSIVPNPSAVVSIDVCEDPSGVHQSIVILTSNGNLTHHSIENRNWISTLIDSKVDFFMCGDKFKGCIPILKDAIWSFSRCGYSIFLNKIRIFERFFKNSNSIAIYPVPEKAVVYFLEQEAILKISSAKPIAVNLKADVFLSDCVANMFVLKMVEEAQDLALHYRKCSLFPHMMETALSNIVQNNLNTNDLLSTLKLFNDFLINTLGNSEVYLSIITKSLRKIDLSYWNTVFSVIGSPLKLFNACLNHPSSKLIINCYIIIQTAESPGIAQKITATLTAVLIEKLNFTTLHKIFNFINSIGQMESTMYKECVFKVGLNRLSEAGLPPRNNSLFPDSKFWFLEPHATVSSIKWLESSRIVEIHSMCASLMFPLDKMISLSKILPSTPPVLLQRLLNASESIHLRNCKCELAIDYDKRYELTFKKIILVPQLMYKLSDTQLLPKQCPNNDCKLHKVASISALHSRTIMCIHAASIAVENYEWALVFSILLLDPQAVFLTLLRITTNDPNAAFAEWLSDQKVTYHPIREWAIATKTLGCPLINSLAASVEELYRDFSSELME